MRLEVTLQVANRGRVSKTSRAYQSLLESVKLFDRRKLTEIDHGLLLGLWVCSHSLNRIFRAGSNSKFTAHVFDVGVASEMETSERRK